MGKGNHMAPSADGEYSPLKTFGNIFISFVGAGVLGLPYAFRIAGVAEGVIIMVIASFVCIKAMLMLVDCKNLIIEEGLFNKAKHTTSMIATTPDRHKGSPEEMDKKAIPGDIEDIMDYGDIGTVAYGNKGWWVVQISVIMSQIGFCCAYLVFISHNLDTLLPVAPNQIVFLLIIPLMVLANIRDLSGLAIFSLIADAANIFAYFVVFYFDFSEVEKNGDIKGNAFNFDGVPFFLGVAIYCYEGAGMVISLETSIPKEHRKSFPKLFRFALSIITMIYIVFGVCGYISFGDDTEKIITLNMPQGFFPTVVKCCLCFSLFFTYPMMMFPVSTLLDKLAATTDGTVTPMKKTMIRIGLVMTSVIFTLAIPDFAIIMGLIGSSCCMLLALILPGLFHLKLFKSKLTTLDTIFDVCIVVLGIVGSILGMGDALERISQRMAGTDGEP